MAKETNYRKRFLTTLGLVGLAIALYGGKTLIDSGAFVSISDRPLPDCHLVKGIVGAEDMVALSEDLILLSGNDREHIQTLIPNGLFLYNLSRGDQSPRLITPDFDGDPHGISLWQKEAINRAFVVVHKKDRDDEVRVYDIVGEQVQLVKVVPFEGIRTLNGIQALDGEKFFVTQDLQFTSKIGSAFEKYLRLPLGKIFSYDGTSIRVAYEGILYANGMAMTADQKSLYVASMLGRSLYVFDHNPSNNELKLRNTIDLEAGPDNVHITPDNKLLVGVHPKLLSLKAHSQDPINKRAPAQLLKMELDGSGRELIYSSLGEPLSSVSIGLEVSDRILLGAIFDEGLLNCSQ